MAQAIVIRQFGGPEVMVAEEVEVGLPGPDEIVVRQTAIGVNFHDVYVRSGMYDTLQLPGVLGCEAAGVIGQVGAAVDHFSVGDRIGYVTATYGAYASKRVLPAQLAVPLPETIADHTVGANLLRGMTVEMLTRQVVTIEAGMTVLVHAAAGGVGRLLCQMASSIGATVIGTVGSPDKADLATASGCAHPILYRDVDFVSEVRNIVGPSGVGVVYDSVGADTFSGSLDVLGIGGHLVNFGQSSGAVEPLLMSTLARKSLSVSRPIVFHYLRDPHRYQQMAATVFDWFERGVLSPSPSTVFPLHEARMAHKLLESGNPTLGSVILTPSPDPSQSA